METTLEIDNTESTPQARGKRLRVARMMTGLPRKGFEEKYGISASTIQSWEAAKAGGLTKRGVERVLSVLQQEGIFCTADWLLHGIGTPAQSTGRVPQIREETPTYRTEEEGIAQELQAFRALNIETMDMVVMDDGMEPYYCKDDYVAGKAYAKESMKEAIGRDCIVVTADNQTLLRRVKKGMHPGRYDLICVNIDTTVPYYALMDVELRSAAPVIWQRKRSGIKT